MTGGLVRFIFWRIGSSAVLLVMVSILVFVVLRIIPGDPTTLSARPGFTQQQRDLRLNELGLNKPVIVQYLTWAGDLFRGDFGKSYFSGYSTTELVARRLPATLELTLISIIVSLLIAVPSALLSVRRLHGPLDGMMSGFAAIGMAMPPYWLGVILVVIFAVGLGWFPARGYEPLLTDPLGNLQSMVLPATTVSASIAAPIYRFLRAALLETFPLDYIRTARGKGLMWSTVLRRHSLPNALLPTLNFVGLVVGSLLGGVVAIEYVFGLPGLGALAIDAVNKRDYSVLQGVVMLAVVGFLLASFIVDLISLLIDPRLRVKATSR